MILPALSLDSIWHISSLSVTHCIECFVRWLFGVLSLSAPLQSCFSLLLCSLLHCFSVCPAYLLFVFPTSFMVNMRYCALCVICAHVMFWDTLFSGVGFWLCVVSPRVLAHFQLCPFPTFGRFSGLCTQSIQQEISYITKLQNLDAGIDFQCIV